MRASPSSAILLMMMVYTRGTRIYERYIRGIYERGIYERYIREVYTLRR